MVILVQFKERLFFFFKSVLFDHVTLCSLCLWSFSFSTYFSLLWCKAIGESYSKTPIRNIKMTTNRRKARMSVCVCMSERGGVCVFSQVMGHGPERYSFDPCNKDWGEGKKRATEKKDTKRWKRRGVGEGAYGGQREKDRRETDRRLGGIRPHENRALLKGVWRSWAALSHSERGRRNGVSKNCSVQPH